MGADTPSTPSPKETAAANKETAQWNTEMGLVDQYTPQGQYVYSRLPGTQIEKTRMVRNPKYTGTSGSSGKYAVNEDAAGSEQQAPRGEYLKFLQENNLLSSGATDSGGEPQWIEEKYYENDPNAAPRYRLDVTLSPEEQQKMDLLNAVQIGLGQLGKNQMGRVSEAMATPVDFSQFTKMRGLPTRFDEDSEYVGRPAGLGGRWG